MVDLNEHWFLVGATAICVLFSFQLFLAIYMSVCLRISSKERAAMNREMFGLLKKLEGLTASKREQMLRHYDTLLEKLSNELPPTVAAHTSHIIFDTESKILTRLAELEPNLKTDEAGKKKMDDLIKVMEGLEHTIVNITSEAVQKVVAEGRLELVDPDEFAEVTTSRSSTQTRNLSSVAA